MLKLLRLASWMTVIFTCAILVMLMINLLAVVHALQTANFDVVNVIGQHWS